MLTTLIEALSFSFFQRALLVGSLIAVIYSLLGNYVVLRKETVISHSIANFAFLGVALAILLNANINLFTFLAAIGGALSISILQNNPKFARDSILTFSSEISIAIAIVIISFFKGYRTDILQFLFGNILAISSTDILFISIVSLLIIGFLLLFHRQLLQITFSTELAKASGTKVTLFNLLYLLILALAIAIGVKTIGVILIAALLVIPANTAKLFASSFKQLLTYSAIFGLMSTILGLLTSYFFDLPSGATIVITLSVFLLGTIVLYKRPASI
ncbi:hypothetical protein COV81_03335 [Candidatus Peregrinibacteria bacterium CG11_big_fil_rev_8_21_14_0_20_41_10]|nr:MAG: hypothetical protein COV81_03335 [Candidatus Peregrinibacteria bacterium CG11_big_fil_rev_8_21_14_0_20_41_10]PIZ75790.1 MAG: hypothetical protein COY06_02610 [Candidatus Peregrinibacteria bacterium CG_4_10_14_0_2_um_filter_41_8]PJC38443.1 MAG: hypothetical protein CO045_00355 [Candidatus Peregrinibacteria bacterium CG_4_9_14_0_2_um_filter_41_14]